MPLELDREGVWCLGAENSHHGLSWPPFPRSQPRPEGALGKKPGERWLGQEAWELAMAGCGPGQAFLHPLPQLPSAGYLGGWVAPLKGTGTKANCNNPHFLVPILTSLHLHDPPC